MESGLKSFFSVFGIFSLFAIQIVSPTPLFSSRASRQLGSASSASSSATSGSSTDAGRFGIGAAAGIGGLGVSSGLGSFGADVKSRPFRPFGAYAGINIPRAGRFGAGCSGLSCGFQFGDVVAQLPFVSHDDGTSDDEDEYGDEERKTRYAPSYGYGNYNNANAYTSAGGSYRFGHQNTFPFFQPFQFHFQPIIPQFPQFYQPVVFPQFNQPFNPQFSQPIIPNVADFSRIGASSANGNGVVNGVYSSSGISVGPDGKVTTYQSGSGSPPTIETRFGKPGEVNGVFSSSGMNVRPDGKVTAYKQSGHF